MGGLVVIGNSAAGIAAVEAIRRVDSSAPVTLISDEPYACYARCLITDVVADGRPVGALSLRQAGFYRELGVDFLAKERVVRLDVRGRKVQLASGREVGYDRLLVATGAAAVRLDVPGAGLPGVYSLRSYEDARAIGEAAGLVRQAVVVGAGPVGLKAALALKKRGVERVAVVEQRENVLPGQLDREGAAILSGVLEGRGISFTFSLRVTALEAEPSGDRRKVGAVHLDDGTVISADLVVIAAGIKPNTALVAEAGGAVGRGVIVNNLMETSLPDVYAAGDVAEVTDPLTGCGIVPGLWNIAGEQGRVAGSTMGGKPRRFSRRLLKMSAGDYGGVAVISLGESAGTEGDEYEVHRTVRRRDGSYRKLVLKAGRLVGALLIGDVSRAGVYYALIEAGGKVGVRAGDLLEGHTSLLERMNFPERAGAGLAGSGRGW